VKAKIFLIKTMPKKPDTDRIFTTGVRIRLTKEQMEKCKAYQLENGIKSLSELCRQGILHYIDYEVTDSTLQMQASQRLENQIAELRDMLDLLFRYTKLSHIHLLGDHTPIPEELSEAASKSASARHAKFMSIFKKSLEKESGFFERLLHEYYTEG
jgi:hypothetical protein